MSDKKWYAVERDAEDNDWGYGSHNYYEAVKMARDLKSEGWENAQIAVIEEGDDPVCTDVIKGTELMSDIFKFESALELAEKIRNSGEWDPEHCKELCELAELEDEWEQADGESFEEVIFKAAEILGVEVQ